MQPESRKPRPISNTSRAIIGSALFVTQFAAFATDSLSEKIQRTLDTAFRPTADHVVLPLAGIVATGVETDAFAGTVALTIEGDRAWFEQADGDRHPAADGLYRLSNDDMLKVRDGRAHIRFQDKVAREGKWRLCMPCDKPDTDDSASVAQADTVMRGPSVDDRLAREGKWRLCMPCDKPEPDEAGGTVSVAQALEHVKAGETLAREGKWRLCMPCDKPEPDESTVTVSVREAVDRFVG